MRQIEIARVGLDHIERDIGDFKLGTAGAAGQPFDRVAVFVARAEIESGVIGTFTQGFVELADAFKPDGPVIVINFAQAADDVAHRRIARRQPVLLGDQSFLDIAAALFELLFQPGDDKAGGLRTVAQAVKQLSDEGIVSTELFGFRQHRFELVGRAQTDDLVGDVIGLVAHVARPVDPDGDAPQIFDQHEPDDGRQRPQFADLEGLVLLETGNHGRQAFARHRAVGMGDIEPGKRHGARDRRACNREGGQLAIELARKIAAHFLDRFLNQIVIIEQPFGGRRDRSTRFDIGRRHLVDAENLVFVFPVARPELEGEEPWERRNAVPGERCTTFMKLIDGEIGRADRIVVIDRLDLGFGRRRGRRVMKGHGYGFWIQAVLKGPVVVPDGLLP